MKYDIVHSWSGDYMGPLITDVCLDLFIKGLITGASFEYCN